MMIKGKAKFHVFKGLLEEKYMSICNLECSKEGLMIGFIEALVCDAIFCTPINEVRRSEDLYSQPQFIWNRGVVVIVLYAALTYLCDKKHMYQ